MTAILCARCCALTRASRLLQKRQEPRRLPSPGGRGDEKDEAGHGWSGGGIGEADRKGGWGSQKICARSGSDDDEERDRGVTRMSDMTAVTE